MQSVDDIKESLRQAARTATLTDLSAEGRKRVRLVRPESIAQLVQAEVERRLAQSRSELALAHRRIAELQMLLAEAEAAGQVPAPPSPTAVAGPSVTDALDRLTAQMNDRLERFGKKLGISAAVESSQQDLSGLFRAEQPHLESNLAALEPKQTSAGGIAGSLAKLKQMKQTGSLPAEPS